MCFDKDCFNACAADAKNTLNFCLGLADKQFDALMNAIELNYKLCKDKCWGNREFPIYGRVGCFAICNTISTMQASLVLSYMTGWLTGCAASYTAQIAFCTAQATYTVPDGCPCDQ